MRRSVLLSLLALAACASSGSTGESVQTVHVVGSGGGFLRVRGDDGAKLVGIDYPVNRVWDALPAVFDSLGLPISEHDPANHIIGISGMKAHKQLGKTSLAKYIDCGSAQGYPSAETYDIQLSVRTQVEARDKNATTIGTVVEAVGRPMAFSGEYVRCTTKGALEETIVEAVKRQLGH
jgi:hypothetical protein